MTDVRLEWGPTGGAEAARGATLAVVVDVLSWTTCVTIAVQRGIEVHPFRWRDPHGAQQYADRVGATLAVRRGEPGGVSLSPASVLGADGVERLVLPSPNGSTVAALLADAGATVVAASLRNARTVAGWVLEQAAGCVAVVPAGERWPDGSLRPAVEDLWGAGAVITALADLGETVLTPEAEAAAAAFRVATGPGRQLAAGLRGCRSGQELLDGGYDEDVRLAAELDVSDAVPVLRGGAFTRG
jgi:2-phosphosulfolactate phosphatase